MIIIIFQVRSTTVLIRAGHIIIGYRLYNIVGSTYVPVAIPVYHCKMLKEATAAEVAVIVRQSLDIISGHHVINVRYIVKFASGWITVAAVRQVVTNKLSSTGWLENKNETTNYWQSWLLAQSCICTLYYIIISTLYYYL